MPETSPNDIVVEEELETEDVEVKGTKNEEANNEDSEAAESDGQHTTISHQSDHLSANNKTVGLMESGLTLQG